MLLQELTHRPLWDFELSAICLAEGFVAFKTHTNRLSGNDKIYCPRAEVRDE